MPTSQLGTPSSQPGQLVIGAAAPAAVVVITGPPTTTTLAFASPYGGNGPASLTLGHDGLLASPTPVTLSDGGAGGAFSPASGALVPTGGSTVPIAYRPPSPPPAAPITLTAAIGVLVPASVQVIVTSMTACLTSVVGFPPGLVGGSSPGFGYQVDSGSGYGPLVTSGIGEDVPGTYLATANVPTSSLVKVKWSSGSGIVVVDASPQFAPAGQSALGVPPGSNPVLADSLGRVVLAPAGLDAIEVELGINARQALSPILAAMAGVASGAGSGVINFSGGNTSTIRISATADNAGNRTQVILSLPA